jgi:hypothetical protein
MPIRRVDEAASCYKTIEVIENNRMMNAMIWSG